MKSALPTLEEDPIFADLQLTHQRNPKGMWSVFALFTLLHQRNPKGMWNLFAACSFSLSALAQD
jgi:hypothetical protein